MKTIAKLNQQDREKQVQHTAGPWTREPGRFKHDSSAGVRSADGIFVACALDLNRFDRDEEVEYNARLIAAAPELLAALEQFVNCSKVRDIVYGDTELAIAVLAARQAIARAKGEVVP